MFRHVRCFVFDNLSNIYQVYLNLQVYFCIRLLYVHSLILCTSDFFGFFNFSNVLSGYFNLRVFSFVLVFAVEVLFRLAVFSGNLLAGDVHSGVVLDRHVSGQAASPYSLEAYSEHLPAHLRPEAIAPFSYYFLQNFSNDFLYKTSEDLFLKVVLI